MGTFSYTLPGLAVLSSITTDLLLYVRRLFCRFARVYYMLDRLKSRAVEALYLGSRFLKLLERGPLLPKSLPRESPHWLAALSSSNIELLDSVGYKVIDVCETRDNVVYAHVLGEKDWECMVQLDQIHDFVLREKHHQLEKRAKIMLLTKQRQYREKMRRTMHPDTPMHLRPLLPSKIHQIPSDSIYGPWMSVFKSNALSMDAKTLSKAVNRASRRRVRNDSFWAHVGTKLLQLPIDDVDGILLYNIAFAMQKLKVTPVIRKDLTAILLNRYEQIVPNMEPRLAAATLAELSLGKINIPERIIHLAAANLELNHEKATPRDWSHLATCFVNKKSTAEISQETLNHFVEALRLSLTAPLEQRQSVNSLIALSEVVCKHIDQVSVEALMYDPSLTRKDIDNILSRVNSAHELSALKSRMIYELYSEASTQFRQVIPFITTAAPLARLMNTYASIDLMLESESTSYSSSKLKSVISESAEVLAKNISSLSVEDAADVALSLVATNQVNSRALNKALSELYLIRGNALGDDMEKAVKSFASMASLRSGVGDNGAALRVLSSVVNRNLFKIKDKPHLFQLLALSMQNYYCSLSEASFDQLLGNALDLARIAIQQKKFNSNTQYAYSSREAFGMVLPLLTCAAAQRSTSNYCDAQRQEQQRNIEDKALELAKVLINRFNPESNPQQQLPDATGSLVDSDEVVDKEIWSSPPSSLATKMKSASLTPAGWSLLIHAMLLSRFDDSQQERCEEIIRSLKYGMRYLGHIAARTVDLQRDGQGSINIESEQYRGMCLSILNACNSVIDGFNKRGQCPPQLKEDLNRIVNMTNALLAISVKLGSNSNISNTYLINGDGSAVTDYVSVDDIITAARLQEQAAEVIRKSSTSSSQRSSSSRLLRNRLNQRSQRESLSAAAMVVDRLDDFEKFSLDVAFALLRFENSFATSQSDMDMSLSSAIVANQFSKLGKSTQHVFQMPAVWYAFVHEILERAHRDEHAANVFWALVEARLSNDTSVAGGEVLHLDGDRLAVYADLFCKFLINEVCMHAADIDGGDDISTNFTIMQHVLCEIVDLAPNIINPCSTIFNALDYLLRVRSTATRPSEEVDVLLGKFSLSPLGSNEIAHSSCSNSVEHAMRRLIVKQAAMMGRETATGGVSSVLKRDGHEFRIVKESLQDSIPGVLLFEPFAFERLLLPYDHLSSSRIGSDLSAPDSVHALEKLSQRMLSGGVGQKSEYTRETLSRLFPHLNLADNYGYFAHEKNKKELEKRINIAVSQIEKLTHEILTGTGNQI